jgi:hypothetical protein
MRALSTSELLEVWERGESEPPFCRALLLLCASCPEQSPDELAKISIGSRDARLLTLREWTFGPKLTGVTACPACGERLEIKVNVDDVRTTTPEATRDEFNLELDEYRVDFRLPSTVDLREANSSGNREGMRTAVIKRCILKAHRHDEEVATDLLPVPVVEALVARMAELDPQADTQLALTCPGCGHRSDALFDIASFFWGEIQAWAVRILREVHILASAYGWREADILAMSPLRRQSYLSMVGV